nr:hypothetical protein Ade03nite_64460 [Actinoplanes derwentensis]
MQVRQQVPAGVFRLEQVSAVDEVKECLDTPTHTRGELSVMPHDGSGGGLIRSAAGVVDGSDRSGL